MFTSRYFKMGKVVATVGINNQIAENSRFSKDVLKAIKRHRNLDWGEMDAEDKQQNDNAVKENLRIFSAYNTCRGRIWIITEADRSATTILFPDEY